MSQFNGPGRYNAAAERARRHAEAAGVVLIVYKGKHGDGFEVHLPPEALGRMPYVLRQVADQIEQQLAAAGPS
jgi:hypothetical protein